MSKGRNFSAMQPSGRFHRGTYMGALENWVKLQNDHECIFAMADVHVRRQEYQGKPEKIREILEKGAKKASVAAEKTMEAVREVMYLV